MIEIIVLVGIPGSGKSTLARTRFARYKRINLDMLGGSRYKEDIEISNALANGQSMVIDNTNTTRRSRKKYVDIAKILDLPARAVYLKCPLDLALRQNSMRKGREHVPERAVKFYHRILQEPTLDEGFDSIEVIEAKTESEKTLNDFEESPA